MPHMPKESKRGSKGWGATQATQGPQAKIMGRGGGDGTVIQRHHMATEWVGRPKQFLRRGHRREFSRSI